MNHHGSFVLKSKVSLNLASDWTEQSQADPPLAPRDVSLLWVRLLPVTQTTPSQLGAFVLLTHVTHARRQLVLLSKMSAASMLPMCVRASRGLLRLRSVAAGASSPAVLDIVRTLSTDKSPAGPGSATGGLAQAILQEKLQQQQQQQQSQVRLLACIGALHFHVMCWREERIHFRSWDRTWKPAHTSCLCKTNRIHFYGIFNLSLGLKLAYV